MFTDRFLKVPVKVYNTKLKELTGEEGELSDSWEKINPFEIQSYRPDMEDENEIILSMKGRNPFAVILSVKAFEELLNSFQ